jgi:hypothetical protein
MCVVTEQEQTLWKGKGVNGGAEGDRRLYVLYAVRGDRGFLQMLGLVEAWEKTGRRNHFGSH